MNYASKWPGDATKERTTFGGLLRGALMSRVRSTGNKTTEEKLVKLLKEYGLKGWRRRQAVYGHPDFVWRSQHLAVFVDGCFWHGHDCKKTKLPKTNAMAWAEKIQNNRARDLRVKNKLRRDGWKVIRIWECRLVTNPGREIRRIKRALNL